MVGEPDGIIRPAKTEYSRPIGYCIYCGRTDELSKEHIVPYFLAGAWVMPEASCKTCATITRGFEENLSYTTFSGLRHRFRFQSRSKNPPPIFPITILEDGVEQRSFVSAEELPPFFVTWVFQPPGLLYRRHPTDGIRDFRFVFKSLIDKVYYPSKVLGKVTFLSDPINLMRLAAKIAHGFLFFKEDTRGKYDSLLNDVILTGNFAPYFVGGFGQDDKLEIPIVNGVEAIHRIDLYEMMIAPDTANIYVVAYMHLLPELGGPQFQVIAGRRKLPNALLLANPVSLPMPVSDGREVARVPTELIVTFETT